MKLHEIENDPFQDDTSDTFSTDDGKDLKKRATIYKMKRSLLRVHNFDFLCSMIQDLADRYKVLTAIDGKEFKRKYFGSDKSVELAVWLISEGIDKLIPEYVFDFYSKWFK